VTLCSHLPHVVQTWEEASGYRRGKIVSAAAGALNWIPFDVRNPSVFQLRTPSVQSPATGSQLFKLDLYYVTQLSQPTSISEAFLSSSGQCFFHSPGQWWVALVSSSGLGEVATVDYEIVEFANAQAGAVYMQKWMPGRVSDKPQVVIAASGTATLLDANDKLERLAVTVLNVGKGILALRWAQLAGAATPYVAALQQYQAKTFTPQECPLAILTAQNLDAANPCTACVTVYE
jgi:hypothetical protein